MLATAPHGPRVSTDSVFYLSASDSLRAGHGLLTFNGSPLTTLGPGFPVADAVVAGVVGGTLLGARILNALCLGLIVIAAWLLLRRHVRSAPLRLAGLVGMAGASTLFTVSSAVWSEPLFLAFVLAALVALERALEHPRVRRWVIGAGMLAGLSFSVRYSGAWLCATAAFVLLVANRHALAGRERVRRAVLFLLVAAVVPVAVVVRNLRLTPGYLLGGHAMSTTSLGQNLSDAAREIGRWLVPDVAAGALHAELLVAAIAVVGAWAVSHGRAAAPTSSSVRAPLWPLGLFACGYVAFLLVSASTAHLDPIDPRLLSPAFVPAVVVVLAGVDRLLESSAARSAVAAAAAGVVVLWIGAQVHVTRDEFSYLRHHGTGFTDRPWRDSALVSLVKHRRVEPTFSNFTDALYFLTGKRAACWPSLSLSVCRHQEPDLARVDAARPAYLVWFAEPGRARAFVPRASARRLRLVEVASTPDCRLYSVRRHVR
jgi:hypothetical protein